MNDQRWVTGAPLYDPADPTNPWLLHEFGNDNRYNFQPYNLIQTPSERIGLFAQSEYNLADHAQPFVKVLWNQRRSTNQAAPARLFIGPEAGNGNFLDTIEVDVDNPYNPLGFTLNDSTDTATGGTDSFIGRRPLEGRPARIRAECRYNLVPERWLAPATSSSPIGILYWDMSPALWSRNNADQTTHGSYNCRKLSEATGPRRGRRHQRRNDYGLRPDR